jgi:hypothetical protein
LSETLSKTIFKTSIDLSTGIETRINLKLDILLMLSFESIIPSSVAILKLSLEISNPKISEFGALQLRRYAFMTVDASLLNLDIN